ncbi:hypothetical protein PIB30_107478, partial [Stylosanthes scabra]|nr:hypothetical protein [Stylosanthes scabra]
MGTLGALDLLNNLFGLIIEIRMGQWPRDFPLFIFQILRFIFRMFGETDNGVSLVATPSSLLRSSWPFNSLIRALNLGLTRVGFGATLIFTPQKVDIIGLLIGFLVGTRTLIGPEFGVLKFLK